MKVCKRCSVEIFTKDGENLCVDCENRSVGTPRKRRKAALTSRQRDQIMRDLGLVKVRGAMGGTYYE